MKTSPLLSLSSSSPSFGSFSSSVTLAAIAARVVDELSDQDPDSDSHLVVDDDFAFDCPSHKCTHPVATADEIFSNGQIRPSNPYGGVTPKNSTLPRPRRPALRKLMSEEERDSVSNSSLETDEDLICVPPETYCVWKPKQSNGGGDDDRPRSKIKSDSEGFSKRWKLRNILYARSFSEGNEKLVFPAPVKEKDQREEKKSAAKEEEEERERGETKRQSYVSYRKDMIGILKNVNGLSRHLRPF